MNKNNEYSKTAIYLLVLAIIVWSDLLCLATITLLQAGIAKSG